MVLLSGFTVRLCKLVFVRREEGVAFWFVINKREIQTLREGKCALVYLLAADDKYLVSALSIACARKRFRERLREYGTRSFV